MPSTTPTSADAVPARPRVRRRRSVRAAPFLVAAVVSAVALIAASTAGAAQAPVGLGTATSFAVLAGAGITNTGATTITGDVGSFPTTSESGFGTVVQTGVDHAGDAVTQQAKLDLVAAYDDAAGRGPATATVPVDLAGLTLTPGVYGNGTLQLSGALTLDAQGDPNAVFVFQAASTLVTASASSVTVVNGTAATACNIVWQVGSSATLGSGSGFIGTVLAQTSISVDSGVTVLGRLLARTGAVTLIDDTITNTGCAAITVTPTTTTTAPTPTTGTPGGTPAGSGTGSGSTSGSGAAGSTTTVPGSSTTSSATPTPLAFTG